MRILVTGAAGFIGSHFVDYVLENHPNDQVIGFDCLTYAGNIKNLELALPNKRFQFVKGDIRNTEEVNAVVPKVDAIVNFAAETHVDRSIASSSEFVSTNLLGVNVLLESTLKHNIDVFHQISTDEVYGSVETGYSTEDDKLLPRSPYAASKASADLLVESFRITHNINTRITRASNNYGTRQFPEKIIPYFVKLLYLDRKIPLYGDGKNIRDWLNVHDHVTAIDLVLRTRKHKYIYNIGGGNYLNNLELSQKILSILGKETNYIEYVKDRKGHDYRYAMDNSAFKRDFSLTFRSNFEHELKRVVEWYVAQMVIEDKSN